MQKKYPYITLTFVPDAKLEDLVAAGNVPDLYHGGLGDLIKNKGLGVIENTEPLIKKHGIDLDRFEPVYLDSAKSDGKLYGLPFTAQFNALYYNTDLFDRFGVDYPKDGMTWDEAVDLGRKLTRVVDGVQYHGIDVGNVIRVSFQLGLPMVDSATNKSTVNTDGWKKAFELFKEVFTIPGNPYTHPKNMNYSYFTKEKTLAMFPYVNSITDLIKQEKEGLHWNVAQYPSFKDQPNTYGYADTHVMFVTKTSKHKDAAMRVIDVLTSKEMQLYMAREGLMLTTLKDPEIRAQFGAAIPEMKNKNIASIFKSSPNPNLQFFNRDIGNILSQKSLEYLEGKDLNTALREAEEEANSYLEAKK